VGNRVTVGPCVRERDGEVGDGVSVRAGPVAGELVSANVDERVPVRAATAGSGVPVGRDGDEGVSPGAGVAGNGVSAEVDVNDDASTGPGVADKSAAVRAGVGDDRPAGMGVDEGRLPAEGVRLASESTWR